eukprot:TRINITY_DN10543_c0_g1_i1.p1 TRINITY_DN10543_c0_g1~~TRINITY_DN10543_c0_g1_i1.p1  ORF type:complete len:585 (-),score=164.65 TRINITY_DN10543_c0_g1_i1:29-1783(-)
MKLLVLTLCLILATYAAVFERSEYPSGWEIIEKAPVDHTVHFRVALKQHNLDVLEATLLDVADPDSENYQNWWTFDQILDLVAPEEEVLIKVAQWLYDNGVEQIDITGRDFIRGVAPVAIAEDLLQTEFFVHKHESGKKTIKSHGTYIVPEHLEEHIDFISGITELVPPSSVKPRYLQKDNVGNDVSLGYVIPENIRPIYNLPSHYWVPSESSICVVEFQNDRGYQDPDLKVFNQQCGENVKVDKNINDSHGLDAEASLDVQYASAISLNGTMWYWMVSGWMYEFATDLLKSNPYPLVVSMSWGWPEPRQCQIASCSGTSEQYVAKVNTEFTKIGLMGITLVASSGDQGSPGDSNPYCQDQSLSTIFPGASPWVTSVGATMLAAPSSEDDTFELAGNPPICQTKKCATTKKEGVCTYPGALITTGGGFSDYVAMPIWQKQVVQAYLNSGTPLPPATAFNKANRGFPDVSALGHAYLIAYNGQMMQVDGTSCSAPVFGGLVSLLNDYMFDNGKKSLGWINPLLYKIYAADKTAYNDIVTGNNKCTETCCSKVGYVAAPGWDPVTGLGTPDHHKFLEYLKKNHIDV